MPKSKPFTIAELHVLLPRLAATAQLIEGLAGKSSRANKAPAVNRSPKGRGPGRKTKSTRTRAGAAALQEKLIAVLKSAKGMQLGDIARKVGAASGPVQYHLRALRAKKKVRVAGERQRARWFAIAG